MKAIILQEAGNLKAQIQDIPEELEGHEALVKVHRIGICGTDIHAFKGRQPFFSYPRILGHELGVEVIALGETVTHLKPGDRCSVEPYFNRSIDQAVRSGKTNCGEKISVFGVHEDGGMREYFKIDARYLHPSSKLSYEQLALIEPLAIGYHAIQRASPDPEDKILVIGAGPIGMATAQFAVLSSKEIVVMDMNAERLAVCKSNLPIKDTIQIKDPDFPIVDALKKVFEGDLPTVILDATGNPDSMKKTLELAAHGSKIVFIGLFQGDFCFHDPLFHKKEITLMASRNALGKDFKEIIHLIENEKINTDFWITHRVSFDDLPDQFEKLFFGKESVIKAMVDL
ncbi:zinc-binding alcohol dehydrogenase family protein [Cecembia calidifontis]|jgi:2-desacetyl-2-hydroxyethyl bacteriochlorophyllide A dehydrogenase|uniref:2-desacetyl-2-hydroxyethyl bacteriochlorophyllide A dehydrogenase n=1 Tax=Cecembia calidifontis TaxID=1187080 RepID=A0A4Q7PET3_9BACT|nr:zinc-binding alcohol dehydrogenase family protein [Cecembia calidifontis]RZS97362.1 2-desacetyl-2-hydroxyethyl bacteriochlorophyllide A dehydrogenase [Cecembia calidifontis]